MQRLNLPETLPDLVIYDVEFDSLPLGKHLVEKVREDSRDILRRMGSIVSEGSILRALIGALNEDGEVADGFKLSDAGRQ